MLRIPKTGLGAELSLNESVAFIVGTKICTKTKNTFHWQSKMFFNVRKSMIILLFENFQTTETMVIIIAMKSIAVQLINHLINSLLLIQR